MSTDLILVLLLLGAAIVMFVANRPRMDAVALIMALRDPTVDVRAITVVAGNVFEVTVSSGTGPDVAGTVASLGYNLVGNGSGTTFTGVTTGNQVGTTGAPVSFSTLRRPG